MIQINLLPPEYRPRTGTPVARFVAIVAGVILIASATGAYAYTHFIELAQVRELKGARDAEARSKESQRDRSLAIQREIDMYEKRRSAIQTINRSRTLWSRKLDQFFDIVTSHGTEESYQVWLESLEVPPQLSPTRDRRGSSRRGRGSEHGGILRFIGHMAMDTSAEAPALSSAFFKELTGDPDTTGNRTDFFADFIAINNPNIQISNASRSIDEELEPPVVGTFRYELLLRPADENPRSKDASASK